MLNARQLITDVLTDLGVIGPGDSLDPAQAQFIRRRLNQWIDGMPLERLLMFEILRTVHTLSSGTASYTIGTGGDIDIVRPTAIEAAGLIIDLSADPVTETPIEVFTEQRWQRVRQKDLESPLVSGIYYDRRDAAGLGTIYPWPIPTVATTRLVLYTPKAPAVAFADLTTQYTFAPGYEEFLRTNLPLKIADAFAKQLSSQQATEARDAKSRVKRANVRVPELTCDPALIDRGHVFDWRKGE